MSLPPALRRKSALSVRLEGWPDLTIPVRHEAGKLQNRSPEIYHPTFHPSLQYNCIFWSKLWVAVDSNANEPPSLCESEFSFSIRFWSYSLGVGAGIEVFLEFPFFESIPKMQNILGCSSMLWNRSLQWFKSYGCMLCFGLCFSQFFGLGLQICLKSFLRALKTVRLRGQLYFLPNQIWFIRNEDLLREGQHLFGQQTHICESKYGFALVD